jgi:hypothetical protein
MIQEQDEKVRENRIRRMIERQGYILKKSRSRDPRVASYGGYMIVDRETNGVIAGGHPWAYSMNLDEVEEWANTPPPSEDTIGIGSRVEWDQNGHNYVGICESLAPSVAPYCAGADMEVSGPPTDWFVRVMYRDGYRSNLAHPLRVPGSALKIRPAKP